MEKVVDTVFVRTTAEAPATSISAGAAFLKRCFDILVSFVGLIVFSPVFLAIYIAIRHEDGGDAIFRQQRVGLGGRLFNLYKFRSMRTDAESDGQPALYHPGDDRLTRTGRFIREHHLDELPQLWNVLTGDMSLVGYRPERPFFVEKIMEQNPDYQLLFAMRPGVFSYATLYNGYTDTMAKMLRRLRLDLAYVNNYSFFFDIKIIFLTVMSILTGKKF